MATTSHAMTEPSCKTCQFAHLRGLFTTQAEAESARARHFGAFECRRRAPVSLDQHIGPQAHWPTVYYQEWCGEYRAYVFATKEGSPEALQYDAEDLLERFRQYEAQEHELRASEANRREQLAGIHGREAESLRKTQEQRHCEICGAQESRIQGRRCPAHSR